MKKLLYTLFTATLLFTASAQAQYVAVYGNVANTWGTNIPINLTADANTTVYTTYTDSFGNFFDTIVGNFSQGIITASFTDCNGNTQTATQGFSPANMTVNFSLDWCPSGTPDTMAIVINGVLDNTNGNPVTLTFLTDIYPNGVTADVSGNFVQTVLVTSINSPITVYFTDCDGSTNSTTIYTTLGTVSAEYNATYCDTASTTNPCGTLFTATYNENDNSFTLMLDSLAPNPLFYTYEWNFGDGTTSTEIYPTHTFADAGLYNVCLYLVTPNGTYCEYCHVIGIDSAGNPVTRIDAEPFTINVVPFSSANSINNLAENIFDIYPNPVGDNATLSLFAETAGNCNVNIYNATGQLVKTINATVESGRNDVRLGTNELANGIYMMTVDLNGKQSSRSFVK